jgi:ABC-type Co2+ transport system permease subunit
MRGAERSERQIHGGREGSPVLAAGAIGAAWGFAGYVLLWGYTPIVVDRPFVVSLIGTIVLLPIRLVLLTIRAIERASGGPFDFSANNWWIGVTAAFVGAAIATVAAWTIRAALGLLRTPAQTGRASRSRPSASDRSR